MANISDLIFPRSDWNPQYQDGDMTLSDKAAKVAAHHSVTTQLAANATRSAERAQMRSIEAVGQSRFGTGISYNVIIFPSGNAYQGVSFHRRGTHTGGMNSTTRSICFAGNYETNKPTDAQIVKAHQIYTAGEGDKWVTNAPLFGHRDVKGTACPGKHVYARLNHIKYGYNNTPEEGFLMALSNEEQTEILHDSRQINEALHTFIDLEKERRELDIKHMNASAARQNEIIALLKVIAEK